MGGFKRFYLLIFSLASILLLTIIAAGVTNFQGAADFIVAHTSYYEILSIVALALFAITGCGSIIILLYAIFSPGKRRRLVDERIDGAIVISRKALENCVRATALSYAGVSVQDARVHIINRGSQPKVRADLELTVDPARAGSAADLGAVLQHDISAHLSHFIGYEIKRVDIQIHDLTPDIEQASLKGDSQGSTTIIMSPTTEVIDASEGSDGR